MVTEFGTAVYWIAHFFVTSAGGKLWRNWLTQTRITAVKTDVVELHNRKHLWLDCIMHVMNRCRGGASIGLGLKSYLRQSCIAALGKLFTPMCHSPSSITWYRLTGGDALRLGTGKVTVGLAESNGSLPLGGWLIVTCGLTTYTLGSSLGPMLGNEYWKFT